MIFGIGTDIVEVSRIEDSFARFGNSFAERILNEAEWQSYMQSNTPARFLAKRFAAKEAVIKALDDKSLPLRSVEIIKSGSGRP